MTPRSFFLILVKLTGIMLGIQLIWMAPSLYSSVLVFFYPGGQEPDIILASLLIVGFVSITFFLLIYYTLFRTDRLVDKLALDRHFTEEYFGLNIHRSTVLRIAVIVGGGLLFTDGLPFLCRIIYVWIGQQDQFDFGKNPETGWLIYYLLKTYLGYWLMTNSRTAVNFIEVQRKK